MNSWRFLDSGPSDGATNMAVDEAVFEGVNAGSSPPTVRVYAWEPPAVSLGHSQNASVELDLVACRERGFGVVRRPTGGRAVLHSGEITYSVIGQAGVPPLGTSISESYREIALALLLGLAGIGVEAELAPVATASRSRGETAPPCFVSAGRFEIVVAGRKLVGSAQRRSGRAVLQHGSLLTDATHVQLADVLRLNKESDREIIRRTLARKATDLRSLLTEPIEYRELAAAMRKGFEEAWGFELAPGGLSECESAAALRLATDRHSQC